MINCKTGAIQKSWPENDRSLISFLTIMLLLFMVSACAVPAYMPTANEVSEDLSLKRVLGNPSGHKGETISWGGIILQSEKRNGTTDLYIEEMPFDRGERTEARELSEGVFIARTPEALDPGSYLAGNKVRVKGEITGGELGTYREMPYLYPVIRINEISFWQREHPGVQWNWGRRSYYWPDEYTPDQEHRTMP